MQQAAIGLPRAFIWRRLHSISGLFIVIYLIEHLFVNSQAALLSDGNSFINAVNGIQSLPYLKVLEILLIALPILLHGIWGIIYLFTGKFNSLPTDGSKPSLPEYSRNHAYTLQRITSWILLVGIAAHVVHMRFLEYPPSVQLDNKTYYTVRLEQDPGLETLAKRLDVKLYNSQQARENALKAHSLGQGEVVAVTPDFGTATLLMVRETFKMPLMMVLYSIFVIAACFHAFNGLWTFMITWGVTLSAHSQRIMRTISTGLMGLLTFLGLASIWGTYWFNLFE